MPTVLCAESADLLGPGYGQRVLLAIRTSSYDHNCLNSFAIAFEAVTLVTDISGALAMGDSDSKWISDSQKSLAKRVNRDADAPVVPIPSAIAKLQRKLGVSWDIISGAFASFQTGK